MTHDATAPRTAPVGSIASEGADIVRATRESAPVQAMARAGLASRGLTYLIIASIAAQIPFGGTGESADQHGAIEEVASKPFGRVLLIAMATGFAAYALWRWSVALIGGRDVRGASRPKRLLQRFGALAIGCVYAALCVSTVVAAAGGQTASSTQQQQSVTARLLALPAGRGLVIAIGIGVVIAGIVVLWRAVTLKFEGKLATDKMGPRMRGWAVGLGVAGNGAGGIVLALVGVFLIQAAAANNAHASKGLDQTLRTIAHAPFGQDVLLIVAAGLAAYGLYSLVEMRYRRV